MDKCQECQPHAACWCPWASVLAGALTGQGLLPQDTQGGLPRPLAGTITTLATNLMQIPPKTCRHATCNARQQTASTEAVRRPSSWGDAGSDPEAQPVSSPVATAALGQSNSENRSPGQAAAGSRAPPACS